MNASRFGQIAGVDKPVSRLVYGTARLEIMRGGRKAFALLDEIVASGVSAFDTARIYPRCEQTLGRWMSSRGNRDSLVILTKGAAPFGARKRVTPKAIRSDLETSLRKLGTDYVDVYLLHRDDQTQPVGPIVEVLHELHRAGTIGAFGGSNWSHSRIQAANDYAATRGLTPFSASSPNFGLADQQGDPYGSTVAISGPTNAQARDWYRHAGIPVLAWSSLGGGFFSGRVSSTEPEKARKVLSGAARKSFAYPDNFARLARAEELATEKDVSVSQIALAWLFAQDLDVYAIVSAGSGRRMAANVAALDLTLTAAEAAYLDLRTTSR